MENADRLGEYRTRGDYHRLIDPEWSYAPLYHRKVKLVDRFVAGLTPAARLLDVGCGEGVLVDRYAARGVEVVGVDAHYQSERVKKASLLSLPFGEASFDAVLCLDVLEHLQLLEQPPGPRRDPPGAGEGRPGALERAQSGPLTQPLAVFSFW